MVGSKVICAAAFVCLLAGCASAPFRDYEGTAKRVAMANFCEKEGFISYEMFSYYSSFQFNGYAKQWAVDEEKLQAYYRMELDRISSYKPSKEQAKLDCGHILTVAQRVSPNKAVRQQSSSEYKYEPPKTTNCMTTYGWTRCTTN